MKSRPMTRWFSLLTVVLVIMVPFASIAQTGGVMNTDDENPGTTATGGAAAVDTGTATAAGTAAAAPQTAATGTGAADGNTTAAAINATAGQQQGGGGIGGFFNRFFERLNTFLGRFLSILQQILQIFGVVTDGINNINNVGAGANQGGGNAGTGANAGTGTAAGGLWNQVTGAASSLGQRIGQIARSFTTRYAARGSFPYAAGTQNGNLGCANVVSAVLKEAGVPIAGSLSVDGVKSQLLGAQWRIVRPPPYQPGDVVVWARGSSGHKHIGVVAQNGNTMMAMNNSSSQRRPIFSSINYRAVECILRKA